MPRLHAGKCACVQMTVQAGNDTVQSGHDYQRYMWQCINIVTPAASHFLVIHACNADPCVILRGYVARVTEHQGCIEIIIVRLRVVLNLCAGIFV
jgi:hypothetical protein